LTSELALQFLRGAAMSVNRVESEVGQVRRTLLTVICGGAVASGANGAPPHCAR